VAEAGGQLWGRSVFCSLAPGCIPGGVLPAYDVFGKKLKIFVSLFAMPHVYKKGMVEVFFHQKEKRITARRQRV